MRRLKIICLTIALIFPAILSAGQIYGSISYAGKAVANAPIEIKCNGAVVNGATAPDGSYRVNVPQQGQCTLTLTSYAGPPSAVVFSYPNPSLYNFELVGPTKGSYTLRRK
jgi:hypothetical protein